MFSSSWPTSGGPKRSATPATSMRQPPTSINLRRKVWTLSKWFLVCPCAVLRAQPCSPVQYPLTHGVYINDLPLVPKAKTVGECFRDAGYNTGYIGKWQCVWKSRRT